MQETCRRSQDEVSFLRDECRIVASPLKRTLQTVQHGLEWLRDCHVPVEVRAEWQVSFTHEVGTVDILLRLT